MNIRISTLLILAVLFIAPSSSFSQNYNCRKATKAEAQQAIARYVRMESITNNKLIHSYLINKSAIALMMQDRECEGIRVYNSLNNDRYPLAFLWPTGADSHILTRKKVEAVTDWNLCPNNCDFEFMPDYRYPPQAIKPVIEKESKEASKEISRYVNFHKRNSIRSVFLPKMEILKPFVNTYFNNALRVYIALEKDQTTHCLYVVPANEYGESIWTEAMYLNADAICTDDCF